ncbi:hypothetical protein [Arthrobacter sp. NPDC056493]|uniref:hypothetical protein n=1 Tax=Arthrobacter sp. NPDC056493 TaxID=3345839 RepID=UPI0036723D0C
MSKCTADVTGSANAGATNGSGSEPPAPVDVNPLASTPDTCKGLDAVETFARDLERMIRTAAGAEGYLTQACQTEAGTFLHVEISGVGSLVVAIRQTGHGAGV